MPTRNINLTDRYDAFLSRQVASGRFQNASEAVRAALGLLERQEREDEARIDALRRDVRAAITEMERGEGIVIDGPEGLDILFPPLSASRQGR